MVTLRYVRVPVSEVRVRLGTGFGELLDISASGALVRIDRQLPIASDAQLVLDVKPEPVALKARVVRIEEDPQSNDPRLWLVGVTFIEVTAQAKHAVAQLCGNLFHVQE